MLLIVCSLLSLHGPTVLRSWLGPIFALTRTLGAFPPATEFLEVQARLSRALDAEAVALADRPSLDGDDEDDLARAA